MNLVSPDIERYTASHCEEEGMLFQEIRHFTESLPLARMLSGHLVGRFLKMLVQISGSKRALEIGTFTGYSALAIAEGLPQDGHLVTVDIDAAMSETAQQFFSKAAWGKKITRAVGDAKSVVAGLPGPFDFVFLDGAKEDYWPITELLLDKMPVGGLIVADNTLWSGRVLDPYPSDADTIGITHFNRQVKAHPNIEGVLLTVRDGLHIVRKKAS